MAHDSFTVNTDPRHDYVDRTDRAPYVDSAGVTRVHTRCSVCGNVDNRAV